MLLFHSARELESLRFRYFHDILPMGREAAMLEMPDAGAR